MMHNCSPEILADVLVYERLYYTFNKMNLSSLKLIPDSFPFKLKSTISVDQPSNDFREQILQYGEEIT